jgi:hypothetical protein
VTLGYGWGCWRRPGGNEIQSSYLRVRTRFRFSGSVTLGLVMTSLTSSVMLRKTVTALMDRVGIFSG